MSLQTPIRLCAVATSSPGVDIIQNLRAIPDNGIEHMVSFGGTDADYKASSLLRLTMAEGTRGHVMAEDRFTGAAATFARSPEFAGILLEAMDTLQRGAEGHTYRNHNLKHPTDYLNYVSIIADRLADLLLSEQITCVVFFDIPHLFYDILLYRLARHLGLRTLILRVGFDPGQFYSMDRIEDFGRMRPSDRPAPPASIERGAATDLYYMKGISQEPGPRGRLTPRAMAHLVAHIATQEPSLLLRPRALGQMLGRMRRVAGRLSDWRDPFARFFHTDSLAYAETIADLENAPINLDQPFVYFPLQMQPEMTTAILGGIYRDQLLAIEQLAMILPDGVKILVKENPKQNGQYRSPLFFHRLARIPAVEIMPSHANTHALAAASAFIATISGTAAWEAVTTGKPALIFGVNWTLEMPGVHKFHEGLKYDTIAGSEVDHDALQAAYGHLQSISHEGLVTRWAMRHLPDVNAEENARRIADTLLGLITGKVKPTFIGPDTEAENT